MTLLSSRKVESAPAHPSRPSTPTQLQPPTVEQAARELAQRVPFRSPDAPRGRERARLVGKLPDWLRGDLVRLAPAFGATPRWAAAHWFDALGMAFGFELTGQSELELRWSVLDCALGAAAASGKVPLAHFYTPNQRGRARRLLQPIPQLTDNANVNVVRLGDEWVAMTETPHQLILDDRTLSVRGRVRYRDGLAKESPLAHPIIQNGVVTNLASKLGPRAEITLYRHSSAARERVTLGSWQTTEYPYIHSFGLTERTGIIVDHPLRLRPLGLLWSNLGIIQHFKWQPEHPTRLILIDVADGHVHSHETEPLFCFHTVHAHETPDATHLDLLAYADASIVTGLSLPRLAAGFPDLMPQLLRLSVDRRTGRVTRRVLSDTQFEFPQVDWERAGDAPQRVVFGTNLQHAGLSVRSQVVRVALADGAALSFHEADYVFGEPLFVGAPGRSREGEGVLLCVGSGERGSALFVLDAEHLGVLAHAELSTPLPLGFHGSFLAQ